MKKTLYKNWKQWKKDCLTAEEQSIKYSAYASFVANNAENLTTKQIKGLYDSILNNCDCDLISFELADIATKEAVATYENKKETKIEVYGPYSKDPQVAIRQKQKNISQ